MKKKYIIKDEDNSYEVTEEEVKDDESTDPVPVEESSSNFSPEEVKALKLLASKSSDLLALLDDEMKDTEEQPETVEEETNIENTDSDPDEEDTGDKSDVVLTTDSKRSVNSLLRKKPVKDTSLNQLSIDEAWQNRFNKYSKIKKGE